MRQVLLAYPGSVPVWTSIDRFKRNGDSIRQHMATLMISFLAGLFVGEGKFEEIRDNLDLELNRRKVMRKARSKKQRPRLLAELERRYREAPEVWLTVGSLMKNAGLTKPTAHPRLRLWARPLRGTRWPGAIGTSGMPLTASGRERPPDSVACKQAPRSWVSCRQGTPPRSSAFLAPCRLVAQKRDSSAISSGVDALKSAASTPVRDCPALPAR